MADVARGALIALAGLTKFAPLGLAPLFVTYRRTVPAAIGFAAAVVVALVPFAGELSVVWDRTLGFQANRDSPFSIWGYYGGLEWLQALAQAAVVGLSVAVAFVPRRRGVPTLAALGAAVLIAVQLTVDHWFYLYLVWFAPLVWIALLSRRPDPEPRAAPARLRPLAVATSSGSGPR